MRYRNSTYAFVGNLQEILRRGRVVEVRGQRTLELSNCLTEIQSPRQRCVVTPVRHASIFAAAAETMWVLAGRNDIAFLTPYIPSAAQWSDDGRTWRSGYGPRIRDWHGVDQLFEVARLLRTDRQTRRAVMSIFDPAQDYVESRDIPCNNWIHCFIRDEALHMNVAIRSNDIWFGFSGINAFEWSVVQEILAFWSGAEVGDLSMFASSLHLYSQPHAERALRVVRTHPGKTCYDAGIESSRFETGRADFGRAVQEWFDVVEAIRSDPDSAELRVKSFPDSLMRDFLAALWIFHGRDRWESEKLSASVNSLADNDVTFAVYDFLIRERRLQGADAAHHPKIAAYLHSLATPQEDGGPSGPAMLAAVRDLHQEKSGVYGDSWKRRGEVLGVLANLARKVDRLAVAKDGTLVATHDESFPDTAADLLVYALKYLTFLADLSPLAAATLGFIDGEGPFSDGTEGFNCLLLKVGPDRLVRSIDMTSAVDAVAVAFSAVEKSFEPGATRAAASVEVRVQRAQSLAEAASGMVAAIRSAAPDQMNAWLRKRQTS